MTQKEKENVDKLKEAMNKNNAVTFIYKNQLTIVEPYLIGELYDKFKNHLFEGEWALRAWFLNGETSLKVDKKEGDRWRIYKLNEIDKITILDTKIFFYRPLYNKWDKNFKRIELFFDQPD